MGNSSIHDPLRFDPNDMADRHGLLGRLRDQVSVRRSKHEAALDAIQAAIDSLQDRIVQLEAENERLKSLKPTEPDRVR